MMRQRDWAMIYSQSMILFEDRLAKYAQGKKWGLYRKSYTPTPESYIFSWYSLWVGILRTKIYFIRWYFEGGRLLEQIC